MSDELATEAFIDALVSGSPPPIDVHEGLGMTLPGLVSELSIDRDGEWGGGARFPGVVTAEKHRSGGEA